MKEQLENCNPTICNQDTLMTGGGEFMNEQDIDDKCSKCIKAEICKAIVRLLKAKRLDEAYDKIIFTK